MTKLGHILQPLVLTAAFFAVAQLGSAVNAMAVYNYTSVAIDAYFTCGFFCRNDWTINASDSKSRPGEAGTLRVSKGFISFADQIRNHVCNVLVDEHGWIIFTPGSGDFINVNSYHQDGSADENCSFVPYQL